MLLDMLSKLILGPLELLFDVVYAVGYRITANPGLSIVLLSLVINFLVLPLYRRADAVQEEERLQAQRLKPGVDKIKRVFKGDERFMILQTYYRQNNYKPYYALKGSLSLLLEIPFFMAAYRYLSGLSLLQGAAFGPIADLGKPDQLLTLFGQPVHLLPILMTVINIVSGMIYTRGMPLKSKIQLYGMALVFLVLLYGSPSGLVFYWTLNNVFSLIKNIVMSKSAKNRETKVAQETAKQETADPGRTSASRSKVIFYSCCVLLTVLLGILIPSAIVNASPGEFVEIKDFHSPLRYVLSSALLAAGTFLIWCVIFYRLSSEKGRNRFALGTVLLSAAAIVNYMFFGKGYGNLSAMLKYDNPLAPQLSDGLLNLGVILIVSALIILLWKKKPEILKALCIAGCIGLTAMSVININGIRLASAELNELEGNKGEDPSFTLSRNGKNVVVLMLDRCISSFVPYIFEENPTVAEQFRGFTYYPNTLSYGKNTNVATPALFAGYEYRPFELDKRTDQSLPEKQNEALKVLPVLFSENGFDTTVCDPPYAGYLWIPDLSIFDDYPAIHTYNTYGAFIDSEKAMIEKKDRTINRNLFCYSIFRASPVLLHTEVYNNGKYNEAEALNPANLQGDDNKVAFTAETPLTSTGISNEYVKAYTALQHLPTMTKISGETEGANNVENTCLIFSNITTHDVTMLQEPAFEPQSVVDNTAYEAEHMVRGASFGGHLELKTVAQMEHYQCDMAAFIQVGKWFDYLRENNLWDNTRILVVSDHGWDLELNHILTGGKEGENTLAPHDGIMAYNALMMIKDFNSGDEFTVDSNFMTIADLPSEAMRGLIENPINPFTGNPINEDAKNEEEQYVMLTDWRIAENHGNLFTDPVRLVLKNQNLFDVSNWEAP